MCNIHHLSTVFVIKIDFRCLDLYPLHSYYYYDISGTGYETCTMSWLSDK
jgi:hypothetical protein